MIRIRIRRISRRDLFYNKQKKNKETKEKETPTSKGKGQGNDKEKGEKKQGNDKEKKNQDAPKVKSMMMKKRNLRREGHNNLPMI